MKFGLDSKNWGLIESLAISPLKKLNYEVWIFGSRARGDYQKFSDLDLLIAGANRPLEISKINEQLEESTLPIKVDLVFENDLAESYRASVMKDRIRL